MRCLSCGKQVSEYAIIFIEAERGLCKECAADDELERWLSYSATCPKECLGDLHPPLARSSFSPGWYRSGRCPLY